MFHFEFERTPITKFVPDIKPCCLVILFKILEPWRVVFGPNQILAELDFVLNFKFLLGPHVTLLSSSSGARHLLPPLAAPSAAAAVPTTCQRARTWEALE
jgi:hypothetical protein